MTKTISFVIPVYNEEKRLIKTSVALKMRSLPLDLELEKIIFVNDGSQDYTLEVLRSIYQSIERKPGLKG